MCQAMKGLRLKPPGKQTLNLNVNESAEETSEALVSLQGVESPGLEFMAPFTSPLPFTAPSAREVRKGKKTLILPLTPHFHPRMQLLNYLLEDTDQRWKNKGTLHNQAKVNSSQGLVKSPSPPANLKSKEKMTENWK